MTARRLLAWTGARVAGEGGYIRGLILQAALAMTILALAINDGGRLVAAQVRAESVARAAATAGADTWYRTHKQFQVRADAEAAASKVDPEATVTDVTIGTDGSVTVLVEKRAATLVVQRVGFLKRFDIQGATDREIGPAPR